MVVVGFVAWPVTLALAPAALALWRMRMTRAILLALFGLLLTLGVPTLVGMWGTSPARPDTATIGLLAAIILVWPLAVISFVVGLLLALPRSSHPRPFSTQRKKSAG